MDKPITYAHPPYKIDPPKQSDNLWQRLTFALINDDKDEFMRVINDAGFRKYNGCSVPDLIFQLDAVEIATAVFSGETKGVVVMEGLFKDGRTALHHAAFRQAPRLTKYLLHRGDNLDVTYDGQFFEHNVTHFTPLDSVIEIIRYSDPLRSIFEMLTWLCYHHRRGMEVLRLLVLNMQNTTRLRQKCIEYAHEGRVNKLAAVFMAVPELFLSSPGSGSSLLSELELELNPLVNNTDIEKLQLSLLLDIFSTVGHELAAYIRLPEFSVVPDCIEAYHKSYLEVDFFLRKVSPKKIGVFCPDYYLSFFDAGPINYADPDPDDDPYEERGWDYYASYSGKIKVFTFLRFLLDQKKFNRTDIYRLVPKLDPQSAARLSSAIEKKLSSTSGLHGFLKCNLISLTTKHLLQGLPKRTPIRSENKVMQLTKPDFVLPSVKLNPIFPFLKLSNMVHVGRRMVHVGRRMVK